jgi:hypothetical protein
VSGNKDRRLPADEDEGLILKRFFFLGIVVALMVATAGAQSTGVAPALPAGGQTGAQTGTQIAGAGGNTVAPLAPPRAGYSFPVKQTLNYAVDWRVFPAANAVLHMEQDGTREKLTVDAQTVSVINMIFRVNDKFQTVFDREKGCSQEFDKQTVEGRRQINSTMKLDYQNGKSVLDERNLTTGLTKHLEAGIPSCVTDLLTGVFYASSQPMEVGKSFTMPVADPLRTVVVTMKVEAREELKTPAGSFKTVRVEPTADAGVVKNRGQIWIWYTDDDRHLPVQMRARSFWGTITFRLASVESK